jgi:hypothetical protein
MLVATVGIQCAPLELILYIYEPRLYRLDALAVPYDLSGNYKSGAMVRATAMMSGMAYARLDSTLHTSKTTKSLTGRPHLSTFPPDSNTTIDYPRCLGTAAPAATSTTGIAATAAEAHRAGAKTGAKPASIHGVGIAQKGKSRFVNSPYVFFLSALFFHSPFSYYFGIERTERIRWIYRIYRIYRPVRYLQVHRLEHTKGILINCAT